MWLLISIIIDALTILIIIRAVLSWVPQVTWRYREISRFIERVTEPIIAPFRRLAPPQKTGNVDISPALAIIALYIIRSILSQLLVGLYRWR